MDLINMRVLTNWRALSPGAEWGICFGFLSFDGIHLFDFETGFEYMVGSVIGKVVVKCIICFEQIFVYAIFILQLTK